MSVLLHLVEQEAVVERVSHLTNVEFRADDPRSYPVPKDRVKWFLWAVDPMAARRKPYVHVIWSEIDDTIHIETDMLGNTMDMIEWIYGEVPREFASMDLTGFEKKEAVWEEA